MIHTSGSSRKFTVVGAGLGGDVNGDNVVDLTDLGIVLANFGVAC